MSADLTDLKDSIEDDPSPDPSPPSSMRPTAPRESTRWLCEWIDNLPTLHPHTKEYEEALAYIERAAQWILSLENAYLDLMQPVRRRVADRFPEVALDPTYTVHSPSLVNEVKRASILSWIPKPSWIDDYYMYARGAKTPAAYSILCGLSVLGAWMSRRVWIDTARYHIYPPFSCLLLSMSAGLGKGIAMGEARKILLSMQYPWIAPTRTTASRFLTRLAKQSKGNPNNPAESVILASELSGFFYEREGQYSRMVIEIADLLDMLDEHTVETQRRGPEVIKQPTVTLVGGSNMEWMAEGMPQNSFGGGFFARMYITVQTRDNLPKIYRDYPPIAGSMQKVIQGLQEIRQEIRGSMLMSPGARGEFQDLNRRVEPEIAMATDARVAAYLARKVTNVTRLAMLFAVSQRRQEILAEDLDQAWGLVEELQRTHHLLYEHTGTTSYGHQRTIIFHLIRRSHQYGGIPKREMKDATNHLGIAHKRIQEILADLQDGEQITFGPVEDREDYRYYLKGQVPGSKVRPKTKRAKGKSKEPEEVTAELDRIEKMLRRSHVEAMSAPGEETEETGEGEKDDGDHE